MEIELSQDEIVFQNTHVRHLTGWCRTAPFRSIGMVIHWLYTYHTLNLAEQVQIGDGKVYHFGKKIATFVWDIDLQMPVFTFDSEYKSAQEKQDNYLRGLKDYADFVQKYNDFLNKFN